MRWHILVISSSAHLQSLVQEPHEKIVANGEVFTEIYDIGLDSVFYDFFQNQTGAIVGIELHVESDSQIFCMLFKDKRNLQNVDFAPYPVVWFDSRDSASPMGVEAFGDLKLFKSEVGKFAIAFCPENWISA